MQIRNQYANETSDADLRPRTKRNASTGKFVGVIVDSNGNEVHRSKVEFNSRGLAKEFARRYIKSAMKLVGNTES